MRCAPPGSRVRLHVDRETGAPLLVVDDAGLGIPAAERDRVFDRFYRRDAVDDMAQGTGLGLAIVRSVAERHRARVTLGDSPLGGLRVEVRFAPQP